MRFDYKAGDWKLLLLMALLESCIYFVLEAEALMNTSAGQAGTITAILSLLIAAIAYFSLGERVSRHQLVACGVVALGVYVSEHITWTLMLFSKYKNHIDDT